MLLEYFVGILIIINSAKLPHALEQCQVQSVSVYGHHLANHVISTRATSGLNECVMMCADESRCKSLNFRVNDKSCDLNDADRFTHPQDYGPKHGIVYMDTSVRHKKVNNITLDCFDSTTNKKGRLILFGDRLFFRDMSRIDLVSKNLLANYFRKSNKDFPC